VRESLHYCDYNAGAPLRPGARAAMIASLEAPGNPSSIHGFGRRAKAMLENARDQVGVSVGARAENVVFTSGATEALHLAMATAGARTLAVSAIEHDAVFEQAKHANARVIDVGADGVVDVSLLAQILASAAKPALVAAQLANNETGVVQPVAKIAAVCREHGALLLVDAAQALGRIPVDISDLDATYLVLSSHKIGGPQGAGALVLAPGAPFASTRFGGGQERGRRPGTENLAALAGFGAACEIAAKLDEVERVSALRDRFEAGLPNDVVVFGKDAPRLPNTSNFALPGLAAETAVIAMDLDGVAISSGSACSSGKVRSSRVLNAMGVAPHLARAALRISFGWASRDADVDAALAALTKIAARRGEGAAL